MDGDGLGPTGARIAVLVGQRIRRAREHLGKFSRNQTHLPGLERALEPLLKARGSGLGARGSGLGMQCTALVVPFARHGRGPLPRTDDQHLPDDDDTDVPAAHEFAIANGN